jgi:myo-inositol-1(or 4)-monophosphatase
MIELSSTTERVIEISEEAGEIAKKYFQKKGLESYSKGGSDFATKADIEVDRFLKDTLFEAFPDTQFLTEETAPEDYQNLRDAEDLWIIDPIDGTTNFSRGDSRFAISIALYDRGSVKLGIVHLPAENKTYHANADAGDAYCNDQKLHVSEISDLQQVSLAFDWSWDLSERETMYLWLGKFMKEVRQPRSLGSASIDVSEVAEGIMDGYIVTGVKPWDIAAASLFVQKAGGTITKADGSAWNVFDTEIFASNGRIHDEIITLLNHR